MSKKRLAVILAALVGIVLLTVTMPAIERQLDRWGLLPKAQPLTELYLPAGRAPDDYSPGRSSTVTFTIHNLQGMTVTHRYVVTAEGSGQKQKLAEGTVTLQNNETRTIHASVTVPDVGKQAHISVSLAGGPQISYWAERGQQ